MHNAILVSLFVVVLSSVMFSKLVTPSKERSKATLRDFLVQITPEKEPPSVTFASFEPTLTPSKKDEVDSFFKDIEITPEKNSQMPSEHLCSGASVSCSGACSQDHGHGLKSRGVDHSKPAKEPSKTFTVLRARYTDFSYVLKLVLKETGHGWQGKDCTCADKQCKRKFERDSAAVQRIHDGLVAN